MFIAKIVGSLVSTQKTDSMVGSKLMMIEPYVVDPQTRDTFKTTSRSLVAVDIVGAGEGQYVLAVQGSSAGTIIGIVDTVTLDRKNVPLE